MGSLETSRCAELKSISLVKLLAGDPTSAKDLVDACKENGFFYLDFRDPSISQSLQRVDQLIVMGNEVFALPLEEKEQYSTEKYLPSRLLGYRSMIGIIKSMILTCSIGTNEPVVQWGRSLRREMDTKASR